MRFDLLTCQTPQSMRSNNLKRWNKPILSALLLLSTLFLTSCGFHLQGKMQLAPPLHRTYIQTSDPYSSLARNLQQNLKMSDVKLVSSPSQADIILVIISEETSQRLISVGGTQQTHQYLLRAAVTFELNDPKGQTLVEPQTLAEERVITMQSNEILGSSNEVNLLYQQMRRALAYAIMNRLASREVSKLITHPNAPQQNVEKP